VIFIAQFSRAQSRVYVCERRSCGPLPCRARTGLFCVNPVLLHRDVQIPVACPYMKLVQGLFFGSRPSTGTRDRLREKPLGPLRSTFAAFCHYPTSEILKKESIGPPFSRACISTFVGPLPYGDAGGEGVAVGTAGMERTFRAQSRTSLWVLARCPLSRGTKRTVLASTRVRSISGAVSPFEQLV
jgi:hypothetical protein